MRKYYIGIDNGTSGTIGIINNESGETLFVETPIKKEQSYTKKKQEISRVDFGKLMTFLMENTEPGQRFAVLERPMVNPQMFKTSGNALRCLEAQLILLEQLEIPFIYVDSKQWQRDLLPAGTKGSPELKKASKDIGGRLFPQHADLIRKHKDADGILLAEWARRQNY